MYPLPLPSFPNSLGNSFSFFFFTPPSPFQSLEFICLCYANLSGWDWTHLNTWFNSWAAGLIEKMNSSVSMFLPFAPSRAVSRLPFYMVLSFILAHCTMLPWQSNVWIRRERQSFCVSLFFHSNPIQGKKFYLRSWTLSGKTRESIFTTWTSGLFLKVPKNTPYQYSFICLFIFKGFFFYSFFHHVSLVKVFSLAVSHESEEVYCLCPEGMQT